MASQKKRKGKKKKTKPINKLHFLLVLAITFICFVPALNNDFVNWDDEVNLMDNPHVTEWGWESIKGIFTTTVIGNYNPLPILTFAIEHAVFGFDPFVYHLNNLLLHLICVGLVFYLLHLYKFKNWPLIAGALLFAIHPMKVESVAWVTERKDVLFGAFYLAGIVMYILQLRNKVKFTRTLLILLLFLLALFSKIQAVAFPLSLLCFDYLEKRSFTWKLLYEKWYYFLLSLIFGLIGIFALQEQGSLGSTDFYSFDERLGLGGWTYCIYILKFFVPWELSPLYPFPAHLDWYEYLGIPSAVLILTLAIWLIIKRKWTYVSFAIAFFTFNVMFLLQIVNAGQGYLADRFTYIPYLGFSFLIAWALVKYSDSDLRKNILKTVTVLWIAVLGILTYLQNDVWQNSETLWTHVIDLGKKAPLAHNNRANYYRDKGEYHKALADYSAALSLDPDRASALNSRGKLYFDQGNMKAALADYNKALQLKPDNAEYLANRAASYASLGNTDQALQDLNRALSLDPNNASAYLNRSIIYMKTGRYEEQIRDLNNYIRLNPTRANIYYERARAKRFLGRNRESLEDYTKAINLDPNNPLFYAERAKNYLVLDQRTQGFEDMQKALSLGYNPSPQERKAFNL